MTANAVVRDEAVDVWDGRLRLHVKVAGDGPPLIFFHPLAGLAWDPFLDQLAARHTVYAPEHPGTSPGDPRAIDQVQTFWELLLCYEELLRGLGLDRPAAIAQQAWNIGCTTKFAWPIADHGLDRRLHRVAGPTLVVWGRQDALIPVAYAADFGRSIAGSQAEVIDDCGHVLQADQPEALWTVVSKFLAG